MTRDALGEARRQVAELESLSTLRIRDALLRVPLVGPSARHAARWLGRAVSQVPRERT